MGVHFANLVRSLSPALWLRGNISGATILATVGNDATLSGTGTATADAGVISDDSQPSLRLNVSDGAKWIATDFPISSSSAFTLLAWCSADALNSEPLFVASGGASILYIQNGNKTLTYYDGTAFSVVNFNVANVVRLISFTFEPPDQFTFRINGSDGYTKTTWTHTPSSTFSGTWRIGFTSNTNFHYWRGLLQDMQAFSRAIADDDFLALYNAGWQKFIDLNAQRRAREAV